MTRGKAAARATILVVEGNPVVRKLFRMVLEKEGFGVKEAADGKTALALVREALPDLIVQDLMLEDVDAIQLARDYRRIPGGDRLPIVAVSGMQPAIELANAVQVGFVDFLAKPVEPARLLEVVRTYLPQPLHFVGAPGGSKTVLVVDDNPLQLKLTRLNLESGGFTTRGAADGAEALEMIRQHAPDAVVAGVFMPRLDGLGLCEAVRRDPEIAHLPLLLYSSVIGDPDDQEVAKQAGALEVVIRSAEPRSLVGAVARAVTKKQARVSSPAESVTPAEFSARTLRRAELQAELNVRLLRRVAVQEIELALLVGVARLVTTQPVTALPDELMADCMSAARVASGAIFLLADRGAPELSTRFGPLGRHPDLASFFGHLDLLSRLARRKTDTTLHAGPGTSADAAVMRIAGCDRMTVTPLRIGNAPIGALVTVPAVAVDEYYDRFIHLMAEPLALALGLIRESATRERAIRGRVQN